MRKASPYVIMEETMTSGIEHKMISLADQIFEKLEHDILVGEYGKGDTLTELKLSETLGVSRTPIREALRRLAQENLIYMSTKGAVVLGLTPDDIKDIYEIRLRIEGYAAKLAAERATDAQIEELFDIVELQEFYIQKGDSDRAMDCDSKFHRMIYKMTDSLPIYTTLSELHKKLIKFRRASIEKGVRARRSHTEHRDIYNAIAARNAEIAESLTVKHITNARDSIMEKNK